MMRLSILSHFSQTSEFSTPMQGQENSDVLSFKEMTVACHTKQISPFTRGD
jgi:hypothetical protein